MWFVDVDGRCRPTAGCRHPRTYVEPREHAPWLWCGLCGGTNHRQPVGHRIERLQKPPASSPTATPRRTDTSRPPEVIHRAIENR